MSISFRKRKASTKDAGAQTLALAVVKLEGSKGLVQALVVPQ
jgi:hypothetical protein